MNIADFFPSAHKFFFPEPQRVRPRIYPLFMPFSGCKERCIFCAQEMQTGKKRAPVESMLLSAERELAVDGEKGGPAPELAFFGGTFTALPEKEFASCLDFAGRMLASGRVAALRCSTRPDCVAPVVLRRLKNAGFSLVELGVQSFSEAALRASRRGYAAAQAAEGCRAVREAGLELGVQLLPGMPGLDAEHALADVRQAADLGPACVRLYPCLVLEGTALAALWRSGSYVPWELDDTAAFLARACLVFWEAGIPVIRMGLAEEPGLAAHVLAGPRHSSLGSMVKGLALYYIVRDLLTAPPDSVRRPPDAVPGSGGEETRPVGSAPVVRLYAPRSCQGHFWGWKRRLEPLYATLGLTRERIVWRDESYFVLDFGSEYSGSVKTAPITSDPVEQQF